MISRPDEPLFRNAAEVAADLIRKSVLDGTLQPGQRLKEEQLAEQLGISRTPVREALLILQAEGLLDAQPNRGAMVRVYTPEEISDLYETRSVLEGHAAARAARHATTNTVEQLRASNERFASLALEHDADPLVRENLVFHRLVLDATRSTSLTTLVGMVTQIPLVYRVYIWYSEEGKQASLQYHVGIAEAIADRAAARAATLMTEHVLHAREVLVSYLRTNAKSHGVGNERQASSIT